jgi:hypothetical protein
VETSHINDQDFPEQQEVSDPRNVPRLVQHTGKSKIQADKVLVTVNGIETGRNNGVKKE